jgi:dTDP-3-amino-2,3,6-trideoxy-4-keto-D-glucose/dTDP-3-amino-3,4,6-trideoxy-alpha-D-glucose/dTDP-2,6-dideoxy-D-kanosamine transaminase
MLINDLKSHVQAHRAEIDAAIARVLDGGWLVLGPEVRRLEELLARECGVAHARTVANGTDALELALRALGVRAGDRVATVANAGMYTCTALSAIGAEPLFLDVDDGDLLLARGEVERALDAGVKALVLTHLYGRIVSHAAESAARCRQRGVAILEDCAQAHGARLAGRPAGSFGDAACFSFYPTKNLGALGDGGAVVTDSALIAERVGQLRQYGWDGKYRVQLQGGRNSRLDELQAALLCVFLPHLQAWNQRRRAIACAYSEGISNPLVRLPRRPAEDDVAHLYVLRTTHRDHLAHWLKERDIASDVHYPVPDHRQQVWEHRFSGVSLPVSEAAAAQILTLPCYPELSDRQLETVVDAVNAWPGPR